MRASSDKKVAWHTHTHTLLLCECDRSEWRAKNREHPKVETKGICISLPKTRIFFYFRPSMLEAWLDWSLSPCRLNNRHGVRGRENGCFQWWCHHLFLPGDPIIRLDSHLFTDSKVISNSRHNRDNDENSMSCHHTDNYKILRVWLQFHRRIGDDDVG